MNVGSLGTISGRPLIRLVCNRRCRILDAREGLLTVNSPDVASELHSGEVERIAYLNSFLAASTM